MRGGVGISRTARVPLHRHSREDEYAFVLRGRLGVLSNDVVAYADTGNWVRKPRGEWHTFWNASDEPTEIIEVISPGGFEDYFRAVAAHWRNLEAFAAINQRYGLEMHFASVRALWPDVPAALSRAGKTPAAGIRHSLVIAGIAECDATSAENLKSVSG